MKSHTPPTLADFSTQQIRDALQDALKVKDFAAFASLLCALATREPDEAALIQCFVFLANGVRP